MSIAYTEVLPHTAPPQFQLTVITVCLNDLNGLKATHESVMRQKQKKTLRIEHVVVDGNSDDGTKEWLREMHAQDKLEAYISAPDRGIYDAMNKGINLARGEVLCFLNAADSFTDADIARCIRPILDGEAQHTVAKAHFQAADDGQIVLTSSYNSLSALLITPCCHQAYFAPASLYRRNGGYAAQRYRCCADGELINKHIIQIGEPQIIDCVAVRYAMGGFSEGCGIVFADEFLRLQAQYHPYAMERAKNEPAYASAMTAHLLNQYLYLAQWALGHADAIKEPSEQLAAMCRDAASLPIGKSLQTLLHELGATLLQAPATGKPYYPHLSWRIRLKISYYIDRLSHPKRSVCSTLIRLCYREMRSLWQAAKKS